MIGGGSVALRKVKSLLTEDANVTVISPVLHEELQHLYEAQHSFIWIAQPFQFESLQK